MNVGIGTVAVQLLSWEYLFRIFGIVSLQCRVKTLWWSSYSGYSDAGYHSMAPSRSPTATFSISSLENSSLGTYINPSLLIYISSLYVCFPILPIWTFCIVCYSRVFHDCCHCYFVAMLTLKLSRCDYFLLYSFLSLQILFWCWRAHFYGM